MILFVFYYSFHCSIIYIPHFLSYISRLSLLSAYISSDPLSISSSVSKCLIEYRFLFPLFWYITFFPMVSIKLKSRSISVSPNINILCSSLKFRYPSLIRKSETSLQKFCVLSHSIKACTFVSLCWRYSQVSLSFMFI